MGIGAGNSFFALPRAKKNGNGICIRDADLISLYKKRVKKTTGPKHYKNGLFTGL
jgi:hypothetical protein